MASSLQCVEHITIEITVEKVLRFAALGRTREEGFRLFKQFYAVMKSLNIINILNYLLITRGKYLIPPGSYAFISP